ncbi:hypothetical protein DC363_04105 [Thalassorhabdomicrobium marinisediminis]|uniref:YjbF family lipoprotein n=2 Tax=Thalassorhabdomicrobium marinisediminis TaxID=2170577 RepID=A0A2T7G062_9RHOB|nr:hypothetical protein DC363_04105 [Thalassorhabdomicrobium marinisediminis]
MGAVLAMTRILRICAAGALALLTACGPLQGTNPTANMLRGMYDVLRPGAVPDAGGSAGPLTRAFIEAQPTELLRVSIISRETTGLVPFAARNADTVTWVTPEGFGLIFRNGLLAGTRGFGDDLMGADLGGALASLNGGGQHRRTLDFMTGLDQITRRDFSCTTVKTGEDQITIFERTYDTDVFEETCTSPSGGFKNSYWRDRDGVIWQSRQWISDGTGYLGYQRL